jgi:hypothetical protein
MFASNYSHTGPAFVRGRTVGGIAAGSRGSGGACGGGSLQHDVTRPPTSMFLDGFGEPCVHDHLEPRTILSMLG